MDNAELDPVLKPISEHPHWELEDIHLESSQHRTVFELIEDRDPEFLAGCSRIAGSIRESLEALAHLDLGDAALEGVDPAEIRAALQRAYAAPAAVRPAPSGMDYAPDRWRLERLPLLAGIGPLLPGAADKRPTPRRQESCRPCL